VKRADADMARRVGHDYTVAAAKAFAQLGAENKTPFRFVFASGALAVRDQEKSVWIMGETRKIKACLCFCSFISLLIPFLSIRSSPYSFLVQFVLVHV
jgi:hypothetical protein